MLFSGSSHPEFARALSQWLGQDLGKAKLLRFPDHESYVEILSPVADQICFVVQTLACHPDRYLMELLLMVHALKRGSARKIIAVVPYLCYARQDRIHPKGSALSARLVADLLATAGVDELITMDLHSEQLEGFFSFPVHHLHAAPILQKKIKEFITIKNLSVVACDLGVAKLACFYALHWESSFAIVEKERISFEQVEALQLVGDVKGKEILLVDDMCSTGKTIAEASRCCLNQGAKKVFAAVSHGPLTIEAYLELAKSSIEKVIFTNSVPLLEKNKNKIEQISVIELFGHKIQEILEA